MANFLLQSSLSFLERQTIKRSLQFLVSSYGSRGSRALRICCYISWTQISQYHEYWKRLNHLCPGDNVPASAISYRLGVVRKEGGAMGFTPGPRTSSPASKTNGTTTTPKRTVSVVKKNGAKGKARAPGKMLNGVTR